MTDPTPGARETEKLRGQALKARWHARLLAPDAAASNLVELAAELDAQADTIEAEQGGPDPDGSNHLP